MSALGRVVVQRLPPMRPSVRLGASGVCGAGKPTHATISCGTICGWDRGAGPGSFGLLPVAATPAGASGSGFTFSNFERAGRAGRAGLSRVRRPLARLDRRSNDRVAREVISRSSLHVALRRRRLGPRRLVPWCALRRRERGERSRGWLPAQSEFLASDIGQRPVHKRSRR